MHEAHSIHLVAKYGLQRSWRSVKVYQADIDIPSGLCGAACNQQDEETMSEQMRH